MNRFFINALLAATVAASTAAVAQVASPATQTAPAATPPATAAETSELAEGEVRRIDLTNRKVTLRHGEIKNLNMPRMTMVFQVPADVTIDELKAGDKVRFTAAQVAGNYTITSIEVVP